jgi:sensor domain CHASE-containing protein
MIDNSKNIVYSMQYDQKSQKAVEISQIIKGTIINNNKFCSHTKIKEVTSGIIVIDDQPLIFVSRPILNSLGQGPIHGSLIFGQFLGDTEIKRLQKITHMSISIQTFTSCDASDYKEIKPILSNINTIVIKPLSETRLAGYTLIKGLDSNPALVIRIDLPRDIYRQGTITKFYLTFSIIIAAAILCLLMGILLERIILSRIYTLNSDVNAITVSQDRSRRVKVNGKDEITNLSSSVNQMLSSLQEIGIEI